MFVFTASDKLNKQVYVGSCRTDIEAHWTLLIEQSESGSDGPLFDSIRTNGVDNFTIEEWAFAENTRELKSLLIEAKDSMDALPIRQQAKLYKPNTTREKVSPDIRRLFEMAEADLHAETNDDIKLDKAEVAEATEAEDADVLAKGRTSSATNTGSASKAKRIKDGIEKDKGQREVLRHSQSTDQANEMREVMLRIEQRRQSQRKTPVRAKKSGTTLRQAVKQKPTTAKSKTATAKAAAATTTLAKGRTGSAKKEQRIKEGIAQEKLALDAKKKQQTSAQADEMANILARLDERGKRSDSLKRKM